MLYGKARVTNPAGRVLWQTPHDVPPSIELPRDPAAIADCVRPDPIDLELAELLVWNHGSSIANISLRVEAWRHSGGLAEDIPLEWSLWELGRRCTQWGSVRRVAGSAPATGAPGSADSSDWGSTRPTCTYPYTFDPWMSVERGDRWLARLFRDLGDPYRRLKRRARCNLLRWQCFHAIAAGQPEAQTWVQALVRCDPAIAEQTDLLNALVGNLARKSELGSLVDTLFESLAANSSTNSSTNSDTNPDTNPNANANANPNAPLPPTASPHETTDTIATEALAGLLTGITLDPFPLVSVIVPMFNGADTIAHTLESVLAQTCTDFEILAIDDGSTDETLARVRAIDDERLWSYSFANAGVSVSRNRGLKLALGHYCSFLDADDYWTPNKLGDQCRAIVESHSWPSGGAAAAYSWVDYVDAAGARLRPGSHRTARGDVLAYLLLTNFLENGSNLLLKTAVARQVGGFESHLSPSEDWDYALRLAQVAHFTCVPEVQVFYRVLPTSASANVRRTEASCRNVLDRAFETAPQALRDLRPYSLANLYRYLTSRALTPPWTPEGCQQALDYLMQAIAADPRSFPHVYDGLIRACLNHLYLPRDTAQRLSPDRRCDFSALFAMTKSAPYPLVSIVIPAYNAAETIAETIESVRAQTLHDWEIVLIDDGSTDDTAAVVEAIGDPRIKVYRYPNAGQGESRNRGASHATGEFFAFLDADDLWTPDKIERMVEAIGASSDLTAVAYSWVDWMSEDGSTLTLGCAYTRQGYVYEKLLLSDFIAGGSNLMMWRGAFSRVGGFNPDFPPAEDRDMWLRLAEKFHFVAIEAPLLQYRQVAQSQSANVTRMEKSQRRVIEAAFDRAPNNFPFTELPELLPYYKHQVIANTYKYLVFKQLDAPVDRAAARIALRLYRVVLDNEPTLMQQHRRFAIKLWLRIWLATWLPPSVMAKIGRRLRTFPVVHQHLLGYTRMSVSDLLPASLRRRYAELTDRI